MWKGKNEDKKHKTKVEKKRKKKTKMKKETKNKNRANGTIQEENEPIWTTARATKNIQMEIGPKTR